MKNKYILLLILIIIQINNIYSTTSTNILEQWYFTPRNNDPRLIGLTAISALSTMLGLYLIKKSVDNKKIKTIKDQQIYRMLDRKNETSINPPNKIATALLGSALSIGGLALLISSKQLLFQYEIFLNHGNS